MTETSHIHSIQFQYTRQLAFVTGVIHMIISSGMLSIYCMYFQMYSDCVLSLFHCEEYACISIVCDCKKNVLIEDLILLY